MGAIHIRGPVPGPASLALQARRARAVIAGLSTMHPIFIEKASGSTVTDVDGNTFLDFTGGIGVLNVGHAHPEVSAAVARAASQLTHAAFQVAGYESYVEVAEKLCALFPGGGESRALLVSTGAEAVENAVKIARVSTRRSGVLAFEHAFHGRTLLGMTLTGKAAPYKAGLGPFAPEVYRLPFPYTYRDQHPQPLEAALQTIVSPTDLAAIIVEPVLGEGGFVVAPEDFWKDLRAFCDRYGVVLIADEVQSGFARTGKMFACEHFGAAPDLITVAKSIAGGLPLAAVVGRAQLMNAVAKGGVGGTFAGNPIACQAALASIRILEHLVASGRAADLGKRLRDRLRAIMDHVELIGDVRGLGAMQAIELVQDRRTRQPACAETQGVIARARDQGLLLLSAGTLGNVIRFLFPLTISDAELDEGMAVLENVLSTP